MLLPAYDLCKAAQAAAFFAIKSGGVINVLKLSKLMYLAERESMRRYDEPMFFDGLASMPDGPVASITLNFINGENMSPEWSSVVGARIGYDIPLARKNITIDDLDHLSRADRVYSKIYGIGLGRGTASNCVIGPMCLRISLSGRTQRDHRDP